nr:hypothetical protein [Roseobacter litoralis]
MAGVIERKDRVLYKIIALARALAADYGVFACRALDEAGYLPAARLKNGVAAHINR